ncbi:hypothetical protein ALC56_10546 [Trachymyrmex septentrionalis]|uniref:CCHC-type domain-containing protein n=1 Tax=Trachymyrmex septentrionalis TaxID=34720 RepID=A0A151JU10_9HYME|nr:hypothetical protein ALC56_10546 [Trachymyrmex septentrionalis]
MLDRSDLLQITKKNRQTGKKRKLQECPLVDFLTSNQKTAVENVTYKFFEMNNNGQKGDSLAERLNSLFKDREGVRVVRRTEFLGHTRANCRSTLDKSSGCFNCGEEGHTAVNCRASSHCPVCAARNLPAGHKAGGEGCIPYNGPVRPIGQINVNRSRPAQDLIARVCEEERLGLVAVSEPHSVRGECWLFFSNVPPTAALVWQHSSVPCSPLFKGKGFVAVEWGKLEVFSCYFSPNLPDAKFERGLCDLGARVQSCDRRSLFVLGDFNARSPAWDRGESNHRGRTLARWAAGLDLILFNEGFVPTCVHPRGVSCVDLS